jgi:AcrR family transcriptional regulator
MGRRAGSQGAQTEAALRDAALRLIARHGYAALSMRRLGEELGLGAAALYRYYPNKQAILMHLLETHMHDLLAAWQSARLPATRPAPERLEAFTRFHVRHHLPRADGVFLSYMELRNLEPENFARIETLRRTYEKDLAAILEAGHTQGTLEVRSTSVAARAVIALLTGITTWYRADGPLDPDQIEDTYWGFVARLCGLPETDWETTRCSMRA